MDSTIIKSTAGHGIGGTNVHIRLIDGITKRVKKEIDEHNITTSIALMSVAKLIYGIYDSYTPDRVYPNVPHFVAVGTGDSDPSVGNNALDNEIQPSDYSNTRIPITSRNLIPDLYNEKVSVVFTTYVPSHVLYQSNGVDVAINEIGLFTSPTGNNCWARAKLSSPITKSSTDVLDITWTINIKPID